jgi:hypothetical protein
MNTLDKMQFLSTAPGAQVQLFAWGGGNTWSFSWEGKIDGSSAKLSQNSPTIIAAVDLVYERFLLLTNALPELASKMLAAPDFQEADHLRTDDGIPF